MSKKKQNLPGSSNVKVAEAAPLKQAYTVSDPFYQGSFFKKYWAASLMILGLCFALYQACLPFGYVLDDQMVITGNSYTKKGFSGIYDIMTTESFEGYFGEKKELVQGNRYRPLSIVTFAIEYGIFGDTNPWVSHFINILLYALTGILLMLVLTMLFRNYKSNPWWFAVPFVASIIFIAHPIHTEAVANIKGRDEIMSMLFSLAALYGALRYTDTNASKWLFVSLISYFLGLLSKENAITFLAIIPLTIYFFSEKNGAKIRSIALWLFVATILYLILRFNTAGVPKFGQQINDLMNNPFLGMTPAEKFGSIMYTLGKYIALLFWPHPLSHDYYPYAIPKASIFTLIPLVSLLVYGGLLYTGFKGLVKKSVYSYAILFYLITLSIVSNIVINVGTFMNERFIFMASAGFCIAAAYFLTEHLPKLWSHGKVLGMVIASLAVVGLSAKTVLRVPVWKDALSLNEAAVSVSTGSARANSFMSTALFEKYKETVNPRAYKSLEPKQKNLLDWTELYAQRAVDIVPDYHNANLMLIGVASERYKSEGNIQQYIRTMKPIIIRRPDVPFIKEFSTYLKGRGHDKELFPFYLEVGQELLKLTDKRRDWAVQFLGYAYEINPTNKAVNLAMGQAYELMGDNQKSQAYKNDAQTLQ
ncbi:MAG: glycosyltransferase family 39 protein [Saprospiraceae bacterium]